ncbi:MAG TPA: right-handed parallel beta-helix repeat-containing protein, partial [Thermoanaerobaculia bacterium]
MQSLRKFSASLVLLALPLTAAAQTTRTFVSAQVGNDANSCIPTAPCRTFGRALSLTTNGGEVIVLDSGGYGKVSVLHSVTIQAPSGIYAGCTADNCASVAAAPGDIVILRGLIFNGLGVSLSGIAFTSGAVLHIENCIINGFTGSGIDANLNASVFVNDTIIRNGGSAGISVGTGVASINRCRIEKNAGAAILAHDGARVMASEAVAVGNGLAGFDAESNATLNLENCITSGNGTGVAAGAGATTRVSNSVVTNNATGLASSGGALLTRKNNMVEGNTTEG